MTQKKPVEDRKFWLHHIQAQKRSGQSYQKYCMEHGVSLHKLQYWRSKLDPRVSQQKNFIALHEGPNKSVKIKFSSGFEVEFQALPDHQWMAQFIKCLGD